MPRRKHPRGVAQPIEKFDADAVNWDALVEGAQRMVAERLARRQADLQRQEKFRSQREAHQEVAHQAAATAANEIVARANTQNRQEQTNFEAQEAQARTALEKNHRTEFSLFHSRATAARRVIETKEKARKVQDGVKAEVDGDIVVVTAPGQEPLPSATAAGIFKPASPAASTGQKPDAERPGAFWRMLGYK